DLIGDRASAEIDFLAIADSDLCSSTINVIDYRSDRRDGSDQIASVMLHDLWLIATGHEIHHYFIGSAAGLDDEEAHEAFGRFIRGIDTEFMLDRKSPSKIEDVSDDRFWKKADFGVNDAVEAIANMKTESEPVDRFGAAD